MRVACAREQSLDASTLIGQPLRRAQATASAVGCSVRPVEIDGRHLIITMDADTRRIDVAVHGTIVTQIRRRG
jgi:hypothetical protein